GNTTQTGAQLGQGDLAAALPSLLAIVFLVIGVFTGTLLTHSGTHQSWRLRFGLVAALLAVIIGVTQLGALGRGGGLGTLSLAMGMLNTGPPQVRAQSRRLT